MFVKGYFFVLLALLMIQKGSGESNGTDSGGGGKGNQTDVDKKDGWNFHKNYKPEKNYNTGDSDDRDNYDDDDDDDDYRPSKGRYNKDRSDNNDQYDDDDDDYDRKPSRPQKKYKNKKPDRMGSMNIYVKEKSKGSKKGNYKKYRFPAACYNRKSFPASSFGPLISPFPWLPIFIDRLTKQTIIFSPAGGIIVVPPIVNFFGKLIPIGQLILSGYASLVSSGAPIVPGVDVAPLVTNTPVVGPGVPKINPSTGGFTGGVRTNYVPPRLPPPPPQRPPQLPPQRPPQQPPLLPPQQPPPADPPVYGARSNSRQAPELVYSEPVYGQPAQPPFQPQPPQNPPPQLQPRPPQNPPPQFQPQPPQLQPQPPQFQPDRPRFAQAPAQPFPEPVYANELPDTGRSFDVPQRPEPNYPAVISK